MNNNNTNRANDDRLKDLFAKMKLESPSMSFENELMQRIRTENANIERKLNISAWVSVLSGVVAVLVVPAVVLHFLGWFDFKSLDIWARFTGLFSFDHFPSLNINPMIISISLVGLFLLMGDSLIRKHKDHKHGKDEK